VIATIQTAGAKHELRHPPQASDPAFFEPLFDVKFSLSLSP